jgi:acetophenone carboxylase
MYQHFEFIPAEEGSCLNPNIEAGISGSVQLSPVAVEGMHSCLNKAMFATQLKDHVAVPFGPGGRSFAGVATNQHGRYAAATSIASVNGTGGGARPAQDGVDSAGFWWSGKGDALDIEQDGLQNPFLVSYRMLTQDTAGMGKHRGGAGLATNTILHGTKDFYGVLAGTGWRFPTAVGQFGGYAGSVGPVLTVENTNWYEAIRSPGFEMPHNIVELATRKPVNGEYHLRGVTPGKPFREGDSIAVMGVAGGGYGDVIERDPQLVIEDLRRGIYSSWTVEHVFRVAYNPTTLVVDMERTGQLRRDERTVRLTRGVPYAQFVADWEKLRPPPEILTYYGSWPDARRAIPPSREDSDIEESEASVS